MSDMPPKKKRPRVAGQPRPGASSSQRSGAAKRTAGTSRRAPIERLGSAESGAAKTAPLKSSPAKSSAAKSSPAKSGAAKSAPAKSSGSGTSGTAKSSTAKSSAAVARTAPRASGSIPKPARWLAVAGLVGIVIGLLGWWHPGGAPRHEDASFVDSKATSEVLGQTESAVCLMPKPGEPFEKWDRKTRQVLTGKALTDWEKSVPGNKQIIDQTNAAGVTTECRVQAIGVRDLTGGGNGSTGHVLVNGVVSSTGASSVIFSKQMEVVRENGRWLIRQIDSW
ncbi:hypothetical protein HUN08_14885 [Gordonia sp. X0973]|uniref:hypothetical protein n=1 Tax=Gordonia sp. X0973 TaxID=2742602 RepID=UPI000F94E30F|nr:hypothetical protein [Gordonia sp. X0973]QKT08339.1 hypothetical protein HUN08_14885 [Gordonia sp. X0973]